ncbi:hypothetical protein ABZ816_31865 [Actinosynnema sp. NPDC047251]|uniref:Uncharacterized protein n=1 Tax=Saccharothrix espanaensis (strain ATCC 51144 / DSM 44229 / JCM 9112 / NBRC 15066 / NRRL 15764) TaxID=1179773 RepID=K0K0F5_SACES|nr:hypothetical protein [Saccharothrix espanaensis]CCH30023.1 hypothetical protein BN6_27110 [Saccharothrix espanaensis DSM 44229]
MSATLRNRFAEPAAARRLLVVCDFDESLPGDVRFRRSARGLAALPATTLALVSWRGCRELAELSGLTAPVLLIGEFDRGAVRALLADAETHLVLGVALGGWNVAVGRALTVLFEERVRRGPATTATPADWRARGDCPTRRSGA